jgi:tryptophan 2,3-dioxygenase
MVTFGAPDAPAAARPPAAGPMTYRDYLRLDTLLDCQRPVTSEPSERLFIVFHQASELWFAIELDALDRARDAMLAGQVDPALDALRLAVGITRKLTVSLDWLDDHLSPQAFANFRVALGTASTLQSLQFREIEYLSGHKDRRFLAVKGLAASDQDRLMRRLAEPSLWDAFCAVLAKCGLPNSGPGLTTTLKALLSPGSHLELHQLAEALIDHDQTNAEQSLTATLKLLSSPGSHLGLNQLAEALIDHDQAWADWRSRHATMVARHLGTQSGTGGTSGANYLHARAAVEFFPQLWAARLH